MQMCNDHLLAGARRARAAHGEASVCKFCVERKVPCREQVIHGAVLTLEVDTVAVGTWGGYMRATSLPIPI